MMCVYLILDIYLIPIPKTSQGKKKNHYRPVSLMNIVAKFFKRIVTNKIWQHIRIIHCDQVEFIYLQRMQGWFTISELMNIIGSVARHVQLFVTP